MQTLNIKGNFCNSEMPLPQRKIQGLYLLQIKKIYIYIYIMYVGMRSVSSNYDDFRRLTEGAIKLSIAGFGCFQCIFSLAQPNNCN
jgi:hypothetical protein